MSSELAPPPFSTTGRVLVAFLDDTDKPVWSAIMPLRSCSMNYTIRDWPELDMTFVMASLPPHG